MLLIVVSIMECKRKSIPRLEQLAEISDDKFELVEELLSVPLASYSTPNNLLVHIDRLKASCKDFSSCCHDVICATLRSGAIAEGQELKDRKHQIKSAVKNKIDEASKILLSQGLETVSNIDTNSTVYDRAESVVHDPSSLSIAPHHEHVSNNTLNNAAQLSYDCNQSAIVHETAKSAVRFSAFESIAPNASVSNMPKSSVSCVPVTTASKPIAAFNALHHPTLSTVTAPVTSIIIATHSSLLSFNHCMNKICVMLLFVILHPYLIIIMNCIRLSQRTLNWGALQSCLPFAL